MGKISLQGVEFFAYHGFYDEEQKIGNKYSIDLTISADLAEAAASDKLRATINYETLYKIIAHVMNQKHRLLEHVGYAIIKDIKETFKGVEHIEVSVSKFNPPIGGVCERAKVTIEG